MFSLSSELAQSDSPSSSEILRLWLALLVFAAGVGTVALFRAISWKVFRREVAAGQIDSES